MEAEQLVQIFFIGAFIAILLLPFVRRSRGRGSGGGDGGGDGDGDGGGDGD